MENFQDRGVWIRIRIRFVLRGWIRIRIRSISDRIRNPDYRSTCSLIIISIAKTLNRCTVWLNRRPRKWNATRLIDSRSLMENGTYSFLWRNPGFVSFTIFNSILPFKSNSHFTDSRRGGGCILFPVSYSPPDSRLKFPVEHELPFLLEYCTGGYNMQNNKISLRPAPSYIWFFNPAIDWYLASVRLVDR